MLDKTVELNVRTTTAEPLVSSKPVISRDNRYILCCCGSDVKVYATKNGELVYILKGHDDMVTDLAVNPLNQYQVISCSLDGTLKKWNFDDAILVNTVTPTIDTTSEQLAFHRIIPIASNNADCLFVVAKRSQPEQLHLMKNSALENNWLESDFLGVNLNKDLGDIVVGAKGLYAALQFKDHFSVISLTKSSHKTVIHKITRDKTQVDIMQCLASLTCIAAHPTDNYVAVGHSDGKISLWTNVISKKAVHTWVHWHALPVLSLKFTSEGTCLLSGGHESVLVKWPHGAYSDKSQREFLPRLGAPVKYIAVSDDNSLYVSSHLDNSIKVIKYWLVTAVIQGLTTDYLSDLERQFPAGITYDPRSRCLVTNGLPGHLQFYSVDKDKLLFNLDVVGQNYISGESLEKKLSYTIVELVTFSADGYWMATVERWTGDYTTQCRLKIWYYSSELNTYVLNTDVDSPHQGKVSCISFSPVVGELSSSALVSVSNEDNKFRLWELTEKSSTVEEKGYYWSQQYVGYYKDMSCNTACFSHDGSLLLVAFYDYLTIWDTAEFQMCTALQFNSPITSLSFCSAQLSNYVAVATKKSIAIWDLLTYTEKGSWPVEDCECLAADNCSSSLIVFKANEGSLIDYMTNEVLTFSLPSYGKRATSAAFLPTEADTDHDATDISSVFSRVYFSTAKGSILTLENRNDVDSKFKTPTVEQASQRMIASNYQQSSRLSLLIQSQLVKQNMNTNQTDRRTGLAVSQLVKQIGETACVAMPSISSLCKAYQKASLLDKVETKNRKTPGGDDEEKMEVDTDSEEEEDTRNSKRESIIISDNSKDSPELQEQKLRKSDLINLSQLSFRT